MDLGNGMELLSSDNEELKGFLQFLMNKREQVCKKKPIGVLPKEMLDEWNSIVSQTKNAHLMKSEADHKRELFWIKVRKHIGPSCPDHLNLSDGVISQVCNEEEDSD